MHMHVAVSLIVRIVAIKRVASAHVFCQCTRTLPVRACSCFSLGPQIKEEAIEDKSVLVFLFEGSEGDSLNLYPCTFRFRESVFH